MSRLEKKNPAFSQHYLFLVRRAVYIMWLREATETLLKKWQKVGEDGAKEFTQKRFPDE